MLGIAVIIVTGVTVLGVMAWHAYQHHKAISALTKFKDAQIIITDQGFNPEVITIKQGTKVIWKNQTVQPHQIESNPYPTHSEFPDLYEQSIMHQFDNYEFTFKTAGTIHYHDRLNPEVNGTIIVTK
jgi:plastocyanin